MEPELVVFDVHFAASGKIRDLPPFERFAVEETLPVSGAAWRGPRQEQESDGEEQRLAPPAAAAGRHGRIRGGDG